MSVFDGSMDEMRIDHEFELALTGRASTSALTALVDDLRSLGDATVPEPIARRHVAAAAAGAREGEQRAAVVVPLRPDRARLGARSVARAAMAAAACLALVLALASGGFLPTPVQAAVADIAERVGLHLPDPDRPEEGEQPADPTPTPEDQPGSGIEDDPSGPPAGTPTGPPAGTPTGPPAGTPTGPPAGTPTGPPAGTPTGPPAGTPSGPPAGIPGPPGGIAGP